jgi:hypothetical protein
MSSSQVEIYKGYQLFFRNSKQSSERRINHITLFFFFGSLVPSQLNSGYSIVSVFYTLMSALAEHRVNWDSQSPPLPVLFFLCGFISKMVLGPGIVFFICISNQSFHVCRYIASFEIPYKWSTFRLAKTFSYKQPRWFSITTCHRSWSLNGIE